MRLSRMPAAARSSGVSRRALALAACITSVVRRRATGPGGSSPSASRKRKPSGASGARDLEGHHAPKPPWSTCPRHRVVRVVGEARVEHPLQTRELRAAAGPRGRVLEWAAMRTGQRAQAAQREPRLEGPEHAPSSTSAPTQRIDARLRAGHVPPSASLWPLIHLVVDCTA